MGKMQVHAIPHQRDYREVHLDIWLESCIGTRKGWSTSALGLLTCWWSGVCVQAERVGCKDFRGESEPGFKGRGWGDFCPPIDSFAAPTCTKLT